MKIVIQDANIIIDAINMGITHYFKEMGVEFHTTDLVNNEIRGDVQRLKFDKLIADGLMQIDTLEGDDAMKLFSMTMEYGAISNLTPEDCSVMVLAEKYDARLLTGDQKLVRYAKKRDIIVNGILWITDTLVEKGIVSKKEMIPYLEKLKETNRRAPKQTDERINEYKKVLKYEDRPSTT